jgi:hypothetical protein
MPMCELACPVWIATPLCGLAMSMWGQPPSAVRSSEARRLFGLITPQTIPFRNSSSGYFVPRQVMPSSHRVKIIERSKV